MIPTWCGTRWTLVNTKQQQEGAIVTSILQIFCPWFFKNLLSSGLKNFLLTCYLQHTEVIILDGVFREWKCNLISPCPHLLTTASSTNPDLDIHENKPLAKCIIPGVSIFMFLKWAIIITAQHYMGFQGGHAWRASIWHTNWSVNKIHKCWGTSLSRNSLFKFYFKVFSPTMGILCDDRTDGYQDIRLTVSKHRVIL